MKKFYFLFLTIMATMASFAQGPIITMISDGDCSGGNPKVVEFYANGTVDFSQYDLEIQTNANTTWGSTTNLAALGTVTDVFVYLYKDNTTTPFFATEYPSATNAFSSTAGALNFNGDDRIRIVQTGTTTVVDQFGAEGVDGTGQPWEYKDGYTKRVDGTGPEATFNPASWTYGNLALDGQGSCQGGTIFETVMGGIGTYSTVGSGLPTLSILTPAEGTMFAPGTSSVNVSIAVSNFNVAAGGAGDGYIKQTLVTPGGTFNEDKYDTADQAISVANGESYTVTMELVDNSGMSLTPAVTQTVNFSVAAPVVVADLAALRAAYRGNPDSSIYYQVTSVPTVTYVVSPVASSRNQKYIQDASGAVLIDDTAGNVTSTFVQGDGMSGLVGTVSDYNGMLQLRPSQDPTVAAGTPITPVTVTIADLLADTAEAYEAELVTIIDATFTDAGSTFAADTNYAINDPSARLLATMNLRTSFDDADYIGTTIPTGNVDVSGLIVDFNGYQITPRASSGILNVVKNEIEGFSMYPNPVTNGEFTINTLNYVDKNVQIFDLLGKQVFNTTVSGTNVTINVDKLKTGVYFLQLEEQGKIATRKLVIK